MPDVADLRCTHTSGLPPEQARARWASWMAVLAAATLVGGCAAAGLWLSRRGTDLHLGSTYPLTGRYQLHLSFWLAVPAAIAGVILHWLPGWTAGLPWRRLLGLSLLIAGAWSVALALVAGPAAIAATLTTQFEYLADVDRIAGLDVGTYLRTFKWYIVDTGHGPLWAVHVSGHPPLASLLFALLARAGLPQAGWAAALCIAGGASAVPSVLSTVRVLAGEEWARAAAPFVAAAPAALWIATSADALYTGAAAAGVCALAHAAGRHDRRGDMLALVGGVLLGACLYLSYGLLLMAPVAVAAVVVQRRLRPLLLAVAGIAAVVAAFTTAGFSWLEGMGLVYRRIVDGGGWQDRPGSYFAFANPAALFVVVGPAVVAALPAAIRDLHSLRSFRAFRAFDASLGLRRFLVVPAAAFVALAVAQLSTMSLGEVERIWLPWAVWLLPLSALLPAHDSQDRVDLGLVRVSGSPSTRTTPRSTQAWRVRPHLGWLAAQLGWALLIAGTTSLKW